MYGEVHKYNMIRRSLHLFLPDQVAVKKIAEG